MDSNPAGAAGSTPICFERSNNTISDGSSSKEFESAHGAGDRRSCGWRDEETKEFESKQRLCCSASCEKDQMDEGTG